MRPNYIIGDLSGDRVAAFDSSPEHTEVLIASESGNSVFSIDTRVSWPRFIDDAHIVFHNYERNTIGVFNINSKTINWEKRLVGDRVHWYLGGTKDKVVVQNGSTLAEYSIDGGEVISKSKLKTEFCGLGESWQLLTHRDQMLLQDSEGQTLWEAPGDEFISVFGHRNERLVVCDGFGTMKLFELNPFKFCGEIIPEQRANVVDIDLSQAGEINVGKSSPSSTTESVVYQYDWVTHECKRSAVVPCGGNMIFWKGGSEIAYMTLKSYLTSSGDLATTVAEWG